jgi:hypothetical protein
MNMQSRKSPRTAKLFPAYGKTCKSIKLKLQMKILQKIVISLNTYQASHVFIIDENYDRIKWI